jgi:hypothetical protein
VVREHPGAVPEFGARGQWKAEKPAVIARAPRLAKDRTDLRGHTAQVVGRSLPVRVSTSEGAAKGRAKSREKLILVPLGPQMHLKLRHRRGPDG